jgi:hypothetical protein
VFSLILTNSIYIHLPSISIISAKSKTCFITYSRKLYRTTSSNLFLVSGKIVPLTIIKGAGHEHIPIPEGDCAIVADFHSIKSQRADSTPYLTTGFYRVVPGPTRYGSYDYEETKYVLRGQIDVTVRALVSEVLVIDKTNNIQDEATGITHHLVTGDWAFFHVGSKAQVSFLYTNQFINPFANLFVVLNQI